MHLNEREREREAGRHHSLTRTRRRRRLTDAFPLIGHSDRSAQETRRSPQVAGAAVGDPVVATQVLLR